MPSHENLSGKVGQLINVWVDHHYHHQGIATKMIDELIGQNQVGMICLYSSKEVMRLYEKYGFIQKENYFVMYTE